MLPVDGKIHYAEFFCSLALMLVETNSTYLLLFLSDRVSLASLAFFVLFFAYVIAYVMRRPGNAKRGGARGSAFLHLAFAAMVIVFAVSMTADVRLCLSEVLKAFLTLYMPLLYFVLFLPLFFFTLFAAYFARVKHDYRVAAVLLLVVLLILVLYYSSRFLFNGFTVDDEEVLSLESVRLMLNGTNPYSHSISGALYGSANVIGVTTTTNGRIVGTMDYPALFFLSFAPFYFASPPSVQNIGSIDMPLQASAFVFILLVVFGFTIKEEDLLKPKFLLLASFTFPLAYISSVTTYLMLGLMLLAYAKMDSKYAWLPLGLCLSIQEELWLPVLFLFAYSINRHGVRRGVCNIAGAAAVFLAINSYFILLNPAAFYGAVFSPLGLILPGNPSPFALLLLKGYPVLLSAYAQIFGLATATLLLAFLYANRKELVPVFSLAVLLVVPHTLTSYYALFLFFMMFAVCLKEKEAVPGRVEKILRKRKWLFCSVIVALAACMALVVLASHAAYARNFDVRLANQSLTQNALDNTTTYRATVVYGSLANRTVYLAADAHGGLHATLVGLLNQTIIPSGAACGSDYECHVNTNRLVLPGNRTSYELSAALPWINGTHPVDYAAVALYNGEYFYIGNATAYSGG